MSVIDTLITDRSLKDLDWADYLESKRFQDMTAAEREEYLAPLRGRYGVTDLQRLEEALRYVTDRLRAAGYAVNDAPRTDWSALARAWPELLAQYLAALQNVRRCFAVPASTPAVPVDMEHLTFAEANDMEKILLDLDTLLTGVETSWVCSGEFYSGEV